MKIFLRTFLLGAVAAIFAGGSFSNARTNPPQTPNQNVQVISVTAKKYSYTPAEIHVKKGTKVQLRITALDHQHGFKINVYPDGGNTKGSEGLEFTSPKDCWTIPKGQTVTIEFVAKTPGSYPFKCCKFCGFGHMGMKGEVIVDE